ncbi:hypothetical protein GGS26DRAFT_396922 [Hypomontagnella submonticulosa]|nr:hypothetical protein GGS26DRAFT_396922 [Hypomontagnella submonticulosa]
MASNTQVESTADITRFKEALDTIPESFSDLLTHYSGIPKDKQIEHVVKLRNEAYALFPYPCIGVFRFIESDIAAHPAYQDHVLAPLRQPCAPSTREPLFLDLGTCFGHDVRKLIFDGAVPDRLWASDIEPEFIELGFKLFNDAKKLPNDHFLCPGDLLSGSTDDRLRVLDDRVTILHMTSVFHLFSLENQKEAANRCLRLLRKDTGSPVLLVGAQVGNIEPGPYSGRTSSHEYNLGYGHNEQSWRDMWQEICVREEWKDKVKQVDVKSKLERIPAHLYPESNMVWQLFEVWVTFY